MNILVCVLIYFDIILVYFLIILIFMIYLIVKVESVKIELFYMNENIVKNNIL